MADALFYCCPFWFPRTGFGPRRLSLIMRPGPKVFTVESLVALYHIHGSVLLYEMLEGGPESRGTGHLFYLGPPGYTEINSLMTLMRSSPDNLQGTKNPSGVERRALRQGYLCCDGGWFGQSDERWLKPIFVPPSMEKGGYRHWYHRDLRTALHIILPLTKRFLVIGYSFPPADIDHLAKFFVPGVISTEAEVVTVDPSGADPAFQSRVRQVFSSIETFDFTNTDFRTFSAGLEDTAGRIFP
jgi:hypothetical protein